VRGLGESPLLIADSMLPPLLPFPALVVASAGRITSRDLKDALNHYWDDIPTTQELRAMLRAAFYENRYQRYESRVPAWRHVRTASSCHHAACGLIFISALDNMPEIICW
jgi:hypothetical protein